MPQDPFGTLGAGKGRKKEGAKERSGGRRILKYDDALPKCVYVYVSVAAPLPKDGDVD